MLMSARMTMRKILALMALFCGAVSADAAAQPQETWCSDGFDRLAELVISAGPNFVLKIAGSPDKTLDKEDDTIYPAIIRNVANDTPPKEYRIWIVRDHVFWPCP
jgi:hypothetical protein